jgi:carbamoyl-phosphate synthase large subunit
MPRDNSIKSTLIIGSGPIVIGQAAEFDYSASQASRTVPFICKAYQEPYVNYASKVMIGEKKVKDFDFNPIKKGYAIKVPVFSFHKFPNVNKELGPEMKSTGEAIYFIDDLLDGYFLNIYSERNLYLSK